MLAITPILGFCSYTDFLARNVFHANKIAISNVAGNFDYGMALFRASEIMVNALPVL